MDYIKKMVEDKFNEVEQVMKSTKSAFFEIGIDITKMKNDYKVDFYLDNWVSSGEGMELTEKLYLEEEELPVFMKHVLEHDEILTVGAPREKFHTNYMTIIGRKSQIRFDNASHYPELLEMANSDAIFKDTLLNSKIFKEGKDFKTWDYISDLDLCTNISYMTAFLKCALVLESWTNDDVNEENLDIFIKKRILNNVNNMDKFTVLYDEDTDSYSVNPETSKVKTKKNNHMYN